MVTQHLVRLIMELCFLQEKRYWPYLKWFGTAFSKLPVASEIGPVLDRILRASNQQARENEVTHALQIVAERHNDVGVAAPASPKSEYFKVGFNNAVRPYSVLNAGDYVEACKNASIFI